MSKKCIECNNDGWMSTKFKIPLCYKHYAQMKKFGKIIKTEYDPNQIIECDNFIKVITQNKNHEDTGYVLIDTCDYDKIKHIRWRLDKKGYAFNNSKNNIFMHNLLFDDIEEGMVVDHINGIPSDNRRHNLRLITFQNNCQNKCLKKENTSGVAGVSINKKNNKWRSRITLNKKEFNLGEFYNFEDAVSNRLKAEVIFFGDKSRLHTDGKLKTIVLDKTDGKIKEFIVYLPKEVPKLHTREVTMDELVSYTSERGTGALGSSDK